MYSVFSEIPKSKIKGCGSESDRGLDIKPLAPIEFTAATTFF